VWQRILQQIYKSPDWQFVGLHTLLVILLQLIGPEYLRFQSDWPQSGQAWRLLTGHWVHVGWEHLLLNTVGLGICVSLANPRWSVRRWLALSVGIGLGISILFTLLNPELQWYVGFSGVLFGLYFLAAQALYARDRLVAVLMGGAIVVKVLIEQFTSWDLDSSALIGAPVIVDAHLYGLVIAIAIALVWARYTMNHCPDQHSK